MLSNEWVVLRLRGGLFMRERLNIFIIVLLAGLFSIAFPVDAQVIINEFLADNALTNFDDDGDNEDWVELYNQGCLLYTSPSPRDKRQSRMPSSA